MRIDPYKNRERYTNWKNSIKGRYIDGEHYKLDFCNKILIGEEIVASREVSEEGLQEGGSYNYQTSWNCHLPKKETSALINRCIREGFVDSTLDVEFIERYTFKQAYSENSEPVDRKYAGQLNIRLTLNGEIATTVFKNAQEFPRNEEKEIIYI